MRKILYAALLLLALPLSLSAQADRREVREGNRKFKRVGVQALPHRKRGSWHQITE